MAQFRKKPVVIEAWRALPGAIMPADMSRRLLDVTPTSSNNWQVYDYLSNTWVNYTIGDWLIRGVKGEYYPCKPDVFDATYVPIEEDYR